MVPTTIRPTTSTGAADKQRAANTPFRPTTTHCEMPTTPTDGTHSASTSQA